MGVQGCTAPPFFEMESYTPKNFADYVNNAGTAGATKMWEFIQICKSKFFGQPVVFTIVRNQKEGVQLHTLHTRFRRPCNVLQMGVQNQISIKAMYP